MRRFTRSSGSTPDARALAQAIDRSRRARGRVYGLTILIKDNVETAGPLPTTAGSIALAANVGGHDAPLVARLRGDQAVILGKANLSEWANFRSSASRSGWSAVGGQTRNPYALDRSPCGSSSGSAAAVASGMADAAIGTETDGSITCPAAATGVVGLKPTVGLVSRARIVPISASQDTPGPMARDVATVARVLGVIAGSDRDDAATHDADAHATDYAAALRSDALVGQRLGVLRFALGRSAATDARFAAALAVLRAHGAVLVDIASPGIDTAALDAAEFAVLLTEFKAGLDAYLATTPPAVATRSLAALIAFNAAHAAAELPLFGQDILIKAEATTGLADPAYVAARATALRLAGRDGIDRLLADNRVAALVQPTGGPPIRIDPASGDRFKGSGPGGTMAAVAGYPHLTVPMGLADGLPVGLSFIGPAWSEARLLGLGFAYEQASHARVAPTFRATAGK